MPSTNYSFSSSSTPCSICGSTSHSTSEHSLVITSTPLPTPSSPYIPSSIGKVGSIPSSIVQPTRESLLTNVSNTGLASSSSTALTSLNKAKTKTKNSVLGKTSSKSLTTRLSLFVLPSTSNGKTKSRSRASFAGLKLRPTAGKSFLK